MTTEQTEESELIQYEENLSEKINCENWASNLGLFARYTLLSSGAPTP